MTEGEGKMKIYKPQDGHNLTWAQQPTQKDETFYIGCLALFERVFLDNRYGGQVRLADRAMSTGLLGRRSVLNQLDLLPFPGPPGSVQGNNSVQLKFLQFLDIPNHYQGLYSY